MSANVLSVLFVLSEQLVRSPKIIMINSVLIKLHPTERACGQVGDLKRL